MMYRALLAAVLVPLALGDYSYDYTGGPTASPAFTDAPTTTNAPTREGTYAPTRMTEAPSYAPTTETYAPTMAPTATEAPTTSTTTTKTSPAPTSAPTSGPTPKLTPAPTPRPTAEPSPAPTLRPKQPTPAPSTPAPTTPMPSSLPTAVPSSVPTCVGEVRADFCLALDQSGSVCSTGTEKLCTQCACTPGTGKCDSATDPDCGICTGSEGGCDCSGKFSGVCSDPFCTGCPRFNNNTKGFATRFMTDFKADIESKAKSSTVRFSVVEFSTGAKIASTLSTNLPQTIADTNKIVYDGGWTNTQQAIAQCNQTLDSAIITPGGNPLRYILLFTDGTPTTYGPTATGFDCGSESPGDICFTEATKAANDAKSGGIKIITIAVRDSSLNLGFLFSLNSTNLGFKVDSFEEAELVIDAVLDQIDIPCPP